MYGFTPVMSDPPPGNYVELSRRMPHGMQLNDHPERALGVFLGQLVFAIACETLHVDTAYGIEKELSGPEFQNDNRDRWWEKLGQGRLDLRRALARRDPRARREMDRLSNRSDALAGLLCMPLWSLSRIGWVSVHSVVSWRDAVEAMGVSIPDFGVCTPDYARQFVKQLMAPLSDRNTMWAGITVALFCLRLAQARGDLVHYTLIFETLTSPRWELEIMLAGPQSSMQAWLNLTYFYTQWFSTLRLTLSTEADFSEAVTDLDSAGMSVEILKTSRLNDPRYASTRLRVPLEPSSEDLEVSTLILPSLSFDA